MRCVWPRARQNSIKARLIAAYRHHSTRLEQSRSQQPPLSTAAALNSRRFHAFIHVSICNRRSTRQNQIVRPELCISTMSSLKLAAVVALVVCAIASFGVDARAVSLRVFFFCISLEQTFYFPLSFRFSMMPIVCNSSRQRHRHRRSLQQP